MSVKDLITDMIFNGHFNYGDQFSREEFREAMELDPLLSDEEANRLKLSASDIRKRTNREDLEELQFSNTIRTTLRPLGRHFEKRNDHYRVPLASENKTIAINYIASGIKKIKAGEDLRKHTPSDPKDHGPISGLGQIAKDRANRKFTD